MRCHFGVDQEMNQYFVLFGNGTQRSRILLVKTQEPSVANSLDKNIGKVSPYCSRPLGKVLPIGRTFAKIPKKGILDIIDHLALIPWFFRGM